MAGQGEGVRLAKREEAPIEGGPFCPSRAVPLARKSPVEVQNAAISRKVAPWAPRTVRGKSARRVDEPRRGSPVLRAWPGPRAELESREKIPRREAALAASPKSANARQCGSRKTKVMAR